MFVLVSSAPGFAASSDAWRIPRADVAAVTEAATLLATARRRAQDLDALVDAAVEDARDQGFEEGLAQGRAVGAAEAADAVAALTGESRRDRQDLRRKLGRLAIDVVRRVAAEFAPAEVLEAVVERVVRETLADQPLQIRLSRDAVGGVGRRLWPLKAEIEVIADDGVEPGACIVVSARGSVHASLELQLNALERAFAELEAAAS